jgi:hypothetical protein
MFFDELPDAHLSDGIRAEAVYPLSAGISAPFA